MTRFARTYAVTIDPVYLAYYKDVLGIREGKKPHPEHYHRIYWDFLAAGGLSDEPLGPAVLLTELMKKAGFTEEEFAKWKKQRMQQRLSAFKKYMFREEFQRYLTEVITT
jgi:methyl-accepting chemotaxis protein